ncbi:MAG: TRAM domain-containing protein [Waddliaceae bacterium]
MKKTVTICRTLTVILSMIMGAYCSSFLLFNQVDSISLAFGSAAGLGFGLLLVVVESLMKQANLRTFNLIMLGCFLGALFAFTVTAAFGPLLFMIPETYATITEGAVFIVAAYFGVILTLRSSEELYLSIPLVRLHPTTQKKRDILLDNTILLDQRLVDLASSGILDDRLILPRFIIDHFRELSISKKEEYNIKGKRGLETIKSLEELPHLHLSIHDKDFNELNDISEKLVRLGGFFGANIFTADMTRIEESSLQGIRVINVHSLSRTLKTLTHSGENIPIKVQRYGKEPRQGVGYLEDGTMVVINGGAEYIGETIRAQVLSVKHTSSGRMIFSNAIEDSEQEESEDQRIPAGVASGSQPKDYFTL